MGEDTTASGSTDGIDVTEKNDGGIIKRIIKEGSGEASPGKGDTVFVHYVGTLADGGDKFDSSRDRGEEFKFTLGRSEVIKGWDQGVATMRKGELAILTCRPEYAYGKAGSPPKIPPEATLNFEVELLGWEGEDISPDKDKSMTRSIQREGEKYDNPNDGSHIEAHVTIFYEGKEVLDKDFSFALGECTEVGLPEGVDRALKRFKVKEKSMIKFHPKWGYGKTGRPDLSIPPNASVDALIQLNSFEKAKDSWQMNDDEKLEESEILKGRGTTFFQEGKIKLAVAKYNKIVDLLQFVTSLEGEKKVKRNQLYLAAHLNLALCFLKKGESVEALKHCDKALEEDKDNVKGLYRRGQAFQLQKDFEEAVGDYQRILALEPGNKAAASQLQVCKAKIAGIKNKERKTFANMFDKFAAHDAKKKEMEEEERRKNAFPEGNETPAVSASEDTTTATSESEEKMESEEKVKSEEKMETSAGGEPGLVDA